MWNHALKRLMKVDENKTPIVFNTLNIRVLNHCY